MNGDGTRGQLDRLTIASHVIGAFTINLDCRKGGGHLHDCAGEAWQQGFDLIGGGALIGCLRHAAFGVIAFRLNAPAHGEAIGFLAILHERHSLCGLTKGNRQKARGQRIECSRMASFLRIENALQARHGMCRGHADRLVENDPAVDFHALRTGRAHASSSSFAARSCFTFGELSRASILADASKPSS